MKKKWTMITSIIALILITGVLAGPVMSNVEKPDYKVIQSKQNIEIRQYEPMIIAEVEVDGKREDAIRDGFRLIADYIFGNNTVEQNISMTAPVQQKEKIAMTSPVQQQLAGKSWQISFVMPSEYSMESLPVPNNNRVRLKEILAKKFVVIEFSGSNSNENVIGHENQLMKYIKANQINIIGSPKYAFYNAPLTLPLLRRNEVMIEIK
tara:strand:+ start:179 stop:802 length:624 start_codon:yes stop_codon:yes gene_type:complete